MLAWLTLSSSLFPSRPPSHTHRHCEEAQPTRQSSAILSLPFRRLDKPQSQTSAEPVGDTSAQ